MEAASQGPLGFLVVDKPAGMTSHDVVDGVRRRLGVRKAGHLGTLDPMATGVLPVSVGKATRLARYITDTAKEYTGVIRLGRDTSTCDAEGTPIGEERPVDVDRDRTARAMAGFAGTILQAPPAYSAKKISGVPAHRLARRGAAPELTPVEVTVTTFELLGWDPPDLQFRVACSSGTYVRSLARDLGAGLGTGGHLRRLRRTRSGPFRIGDAVRLEDAGPEHLWPPGQVLGDRPRVEVDDAERESLGQGRAVRCASAEAPDGADACVFDTNGRLVAVARVAGGWAHPKVVLI